MTPNTSRPLVSVVVPSYNYGHLVRETLDSLAAQTYGAWECVVVDDGSKDDTRSVVEAYAARDPRVRYVWQENARQGAARNNGMRHSSGDYFQFLDADDLLEARKFERQVEYLERHAEVDLVYSGVRYFDSGGAGLGHSRQYSVWDDGGRWMPEVSGRGRVLLEPLLRNNIMVVNSPLVRRRVVETVGEFDAAITPVEDWDYWMRCAAAGFHFRYEDADGVRALVRAHDLSASLDGRRMMRATLKMRKVWAERTLTDPADLRLNRTLAAECEGLLGVEESLHGNRALAARQLLKAAALDGRARPRAKWLACALLAPFADGEQLKRAVTTSFTGSLADVLRRRRQANGRR
ncbi:MAG TPA: glycosyltransferase family 2 protein [Pyrinomonadaceae bacterium]|jgi:glycosyltransferase involved in cell wall biosynthesis